MGSSCAWDGPSIQQVTSLARLTSRLVQPKRSTRPTTLPTSSTRSPSCWHAGLARRVTQKLAARVNHSLLEHISRSSLRRDALSTSSRSLVRPIFLAHCWALVPPDRDYRRWWLTKKKKKKKKKSIALIPLL